MVTVRKITEGSFEAVGSSSFIYFRSPSGSLSSLSLFPLPCPQPHPVLISFVSLLSIHSLSLKLSSLRCRISKPAVISPHTNYRATMTRDTYLKRSLGTQANRIKEVRMLSTLDSWAWIWFPWFILICDCVANVLGLSHYLVTSPPRGSWWNWLRAPQEPPPHRVRRSPSHRPRHNRPEQPKSPVSLPT